MPSSQRSVKTLDRQLTEFKALFSCIWMNCTWDLQDIYDYVDCGRVVLWDKDDKWEYKKAVEYMEGILLGIAPVPINLIQKRRDEHNFFEVSSHDAHNRMQTIFEYMSGELPLADLQYLRGHNNKTFRQLSPRNRRVIEHALVNVRILRPGKDVADEDLDYYLKRVSV